MRAATALLLPAAASARFFEAHEQQLDLLSHASQLNQIKLGPGAADAQATRLIELAPEETRWVAEEEMLELRRAGYHFFDITDNQDLGTAFHARTTFTFPGKPAHQKELKPLLKGLSKETMRANLETLTSFATRYYKSATGRQSSEWLLRQINDTIAASGAAKHGVSVKPFTHPWGQNSIIATIPGRTDRRVIIGAHQDSVNLWLPLLLPAPGADDDGSGTVTILEAFRTLLGSEDLAGGKAENTLEFHWYSAEEGGLLGSQAIFSMYEQTGADVRAMLQQDMTGYVQGMMDAGQPESMGVIMDFVHQGLTAFIKEVILEYCNIPFIETKCGYACSDHASAGKAGYPSAFVIESAFEHSNKKIHTAEDTIDRLSFDHMVEHAKLTVAFAYELALNTFE